MSLAYQPPWIFYQAKGILIKDVHVLFSLPAIPMDQLQLLLLIRHPCAIADSHIRRGLDPDLERIAQDLSLSPVTAQISLGFREALADSVLASDLYYRMGLYWGIGYRLAIETVPEGRRMDVRYESLASDPETEWMSLMQKLKLPQTQKICRAISCSSGSGKNTYTRRESRQLCWAWKESMCTADIEKVLKGVQIAGGGVFRHFYPEELA
jgi:hypothetical protein